MLMVECTVWMAGARYMAKKVGDKDKPCPTPTLGQLKVGDVLPLNTKDKEHSPK